MTPVQAVYDFFTRHPVKRLGVAVSGGGDSVALLRALAQSDLPCTLEVACVNHGLRPEADQELAFVASMAAGFGLAFTALHWDAPNGAGNLMAQARAGRRALLAKWAQDRGLDAVALGHTQDDVAETFLMRLHRQSGVDGLSAMASSFQAEGVKWVRPLLETSRKELRAYLTRTGQNWCDDPTNENDHYDRARYRKALDVLAEAGLGRAEIAGSAQILSQARQALAHHLSDFCQHYVRATDGVLDVDHDTFSNLPSDQQRRLVTAGIQWISQTPYGPRGAAVLGAIAIVNEGKSTTLGGALIWSKQGRMYVAREPAAVGPPAADLGQIWDARWVVSGPELPKGAQIGALGDDGLSQRPNWRETNADRRMLQSSPAVWLHGKVICALFLDETPQWSAKPAQNVSDFFTSILSR